MKNRFESHSGGEIAPEENFHAEQSGTKEATTFRQTSRRLMRAIELQLKTQLGKIEISGMENLEKIPKDKKVVVAPDHKTDMAVPLTVHALGDSLDLVITNESVHHKFTGEPSMNLGMRLVGRDNFLPIDFMGKGTDKHPTAFNPDNFIPMMKAMDKGKTTIVAAHNPSLGGHLEQGGYGAVYLAEMTDAVIIPVSIDIISKENLGMAQNVLRTFLKKPDVHIQIGEPFSLDKIEDIGKMKELMDKRKGGERLTHEEFSEFSRITEDLKEQSEALMKRLVEITPIEKRGDIIPEE